MIRRLALTCVTCLPLAGLAAPAPAAEQPATRPARGPVRLFMNEVVKIEENAITVAPAGGTERRDRTPATYAIDKDTKVYTGVPDGERKGPSGRVARSYKVEPAALADLKVGQFVRIDPDGGRAGRITIMPPPPPPPEKVPPAEKKP